MADPSLSIEFLGVDDEDRAKKCRQMAEACALAAKGSTPETGAAYLELQRQWTALADEIEKLARLRPAGVAPSRAAS